MRTSVLTLAPTSLLDSVLFFVEVLVDFSVVSVAHWIIPSSLIPVSISLSSVLSLLCCW